VGLRESLESPVSSYMSSSFVKVATEDSIYQAAGAMAKMGAGEAVVVKGGAPVGIITERDILNKVVAAGLSPQQAKVKDVMSTPLETIEESAKVGDAISKMTRLGVRRLVVSRKGEIVGMVTQKAIVSGPRGEHVVLPELSSPKGYSCPYCDSAMKTKEELSKHIDQVHLGLGLLEGDNTKW
jgi:signal-transduction protein with cAMP-binding, CBS, and nucleotidyltransferase domain